MVTSTTTYKVETYPIPPSKVFLWILYLDSSEGPSLGFKVKVLVKSQGNFSDGTMERFTVEDVTFPPNSNGDVDLIIAVRWDGMVLSEPRLFTYQRPEEEAHDLIMWLLEYLDKLGVFVYTLEEILQDRTKLVFRPEALKMPLFPKAEVLEKIIDGASKNRKVPIHELKCKGTIFEETINWISSFQGDEETRKGFNSKFEKRKKMIEAVYGEGQNHRSSSTTTTTTSTTSSYSKASNHSTTSSSRKSVSKVSNAASNLFIGRFFFSRNL